MEQSHFNHIIYFHLKCFALELAKTKARDISEQYHDVHQLLEEAKQLMETTAQHLVLTPEIQQIFDEIHTSTAHARALSAHPIHQISQQYSKAKDELDDYMNIICGSNTHSKVRLAITTLVAESKKDAQRYYDEHKSEDDQRLSHFKTRMCEGLNELFNGDFSYKEPLSNGLFMQIITHPAAKSAAGLFLISGLLGLGIGICALSGLIPVLTAGVATGLTMGGGLAGFTGITVLTAGFFRERSPFEIDRNKASLELPSPSLQSI